MQVARPWQVEVINVVLGNAAMQDRAGLEALPASPSPSPSLYTTSAYRLLSWGSDLRVFPDTIETGTSR